MKNCAMCGDFMKAMFECDGCGRTVCIKCLHKKERKCVDCLAREYTEKYNEKIENYKKDDVIA